ncbi:MAG: D-alanine--D-alanine ligase family protein [Oscillospiraceae bacterium]
MDKISLGIIFGGNSSEYEVSLLSACSVLKNINVERYDIHVIGIKKTGEMYLYTGDNEKIADNTWIDQANSECIISSNPAHHGLIVLENDSYRNLRLDCVFPILHGKNGEDGTIQGLLQLSKIPFVGCDLISSAMCMDKDITHTRLTSENIKNAKWVAILKSDYLVNSEYFIKKLEQTFSYPMFVKPANAGSSVGITKAKNKEDLINAIDLAFTHDKKIIVEETLSGAEIECAVLGNDSPKASIPGEIMPCNDFYDYEAKYIKNESKTIIPARLSELTLQKVRDTAVQAYKVMGCSGLSRVDFFVTKDDEVILNEINTIPGFTQISMYPKMWAETGLPYSQLIDALIDLAMENN